ncbi:TPA: hypothetical protein TY888_001869 [Streptococcus suis]|nr:hypothetical protein [Streptococcus suis]
MNQITCFHCNDTPKVDDFIENRKLIISQHPYDDWWSGKGMYFWDNLSNACYWKNEKLKKQPSNPVSIISVDVQFNTSDESFLDLTDDSILHMLIEYYRLTHPDQELHDKKIGILIDDYSQKYGVKVVKILGNYSQRQSPETPINIKKLSYKAKTIYCVKENCESSIIFETIRRVSNG